MYYLCNRKSEMIATAGCSTVRLVYLVWDQGVVSSNPTTPTQKSKTTCRFSTGGFFLLCIKCHSEYRPFVLYKVSKCAIVKTHDIS